MNNPVRDDRFQYWLADMDEAIKRFIASAPESIRPKLDFSAESLGTVEGWILQRYDGPQALVPPSEAAFLDGAARYVGEIFRERTDSKWTINTSDPKVLYFGRPTLRGGQLKTPLCPLSLVTASTDRRTGEYFTTVLKNLART